jgi:hypothetical protein
MRLIFLQIRKIFNYRYSGVLINKYRSLCQQAPLLRLVVEKWGCFTGEEKGRRLIDFYFICGNNYALLIFTPFLIKHFIVFLAAITAIHHNCIKHTYGMVVVITVNRKKFEAVVGLVFKKLPWPKLLFCSILKYLFWRKQTTKKRQSDFSENLR